MPLPPPISVVDKSGDKVRRMFAEIAPRYDLMNHLLSLNIDRSWRRRTLKQLRLGGTGPLLDVCTGTGDLALLIARQVAGRQAVFATDFCEPMLELARHKLTPAGLPADAVQFIEADTQHLPFAEHTFDAVTVAFGIRNVSDTLAGLREMIRVCRPKGQVAILEFSRPTWPVLKQAYDFYFRRVLPVIGQWMAKNNESAYRYLPASVAEFPSGPAMIELLERAGLSRVTATPMTCGVVTLYLGEKREDTSLAGNSVTPPEPIP